MAIQRLTAQLEQFRREPLFGQTSPIQRLERLERALGLPAQGVQLFVKRDDLSGLGGGGNKLRKLEFLIGEALAQGCDTFITTGGLQSNHARQSAAAAAYAGLACELMLTHTVPRDDLDYRRNGNVLLDELFGATIHQLSGDTDALAAAQARADELRAEGGRPYVVGMGGSSPLGCLGYAVCAAEILAQEQTAGIRFTQIALPNGSAGTHAGLAAGLFVAGDDPARVLSYAVLGPEEDTRQRTLSLTVETLALLNPQRRLADHTIRVSGQQLGAGYGVPTSQMVEALNLLARTEGILLDPVYSAKAFAGVLADLRANRFTAGQSVLFLMTGGTPGLFAYRSALTDG